ncbi:unnamed protein product [Caenorhabditis bovis]|uniref:RZZ complex subunit KNTC1/ROD C-terminal domain-containing protein n=1 Tax=Caenorhabditis bovis TaxID=2654633 RepID=A0A8S1FBF5_9PELO|nr:unnamed protein product [Caenorhabditis bovis]
MRRLGNTNAPTNIDVESLGSSGLYDVVNVSSIVPMFDEESSFKFDDSAWKIKMASNERFLVIASCNDLAVFTLGATPEYFYTTGLGGVINDLAIIGESSFIAVAINSNKLIILSMEKKEIYTNQELPCNVDFIHTSSTHKTCILTVGNYQGQFYHTTMNAEIANPKDSNPFEGLPRANILEFFAKAMESTVMRTVNMGDISSKIDNISVGAGHFLGTVNDKKGLKWCDHSSADFYDLADEVKWVRIRDTGRFALFLSETGFIHVFDPLTMFFVAEFDVKINSRDKILDFIVIDHNMDEIPHLFAVVIERNGTTQMMIIDRLKMEDCFSFPCASKTTLFSYSGSERVLMAIEETAPEDNDIKNSSIAVLQVSQSRPEMRFEALLKHRKFDEAEKFAKTYKLDLQRVYKSRVSHLTENCDTDDESFADLMKTLDLISDHNMVAETCFSLVQMSTRYDRIHSYLSYAKKRRITDPDTMTMIEDECYILATFRIIRGPEVEDSALITRSWPLFVDALHGNDQWVDLYFEFVDNGAITEARVIWERHEKVLRSYVEECALNGEVEKIDEIFAKFVNSLNANIQSWSSIVEHLTLDMLPSCIQESELLVPRIEKVIISLIGLLEYRDAQNWPDNAIKAASCFDYMTEFLSENAVTPIEQSMLALYGKILCIVDAEKSTPILRMKKVYYTLQQIKRLKEVYECNMSFSTYVASTSEEICHRILQNALINPNVTHLKIEQFVKPFMNERHLNQDQTIFNYIKLMSEMANSGGFAYKGWEVQCVQLCASLTDESRRCRSIISISAAAVMPWPSELNKAVQAILKSKTLSRSEIEEMQIVCRRAELNHLLFTYEFKRNFIDKFLDDDSTAEIILVIRCILAQTLQSSRFVDCIKVLELYTLVQNSDWRKSVQIEFAKSLAIMHMIRTGVMTTTIINHVNELEERERGTVIELIASFVASVADTPACMTNIADRQLVLGVGEELISYFAGRNGSKEMKELRKKLILIRELQKDENPAVLLSDFDDVEWKRCQLCAMVREESSYFDKYAKCQYLGISSADLLTYMLSKAEAENDAEKISEILLGTVDCVGIWMPSTTEMVGTICDSLAWVIFRLPTLSGEAADADRADDIAFVMQRLTEIVRKMLQKFDFETISNELEYLLQLEGYLHIGERVLKQSLRGNDSNTPNTKDEWNQNAESENNGGTRIYGFARGHSNYDFTSEPTLFEGVAALLAFAGAAPSVSRPFSAALTEDDANEYRATWESLTMFFGMHSQGLLDIHSRVFASSLKCWSGEWRQAIVEMNDSVVSVVDRMIQQNRFDAWHAVGLLSMMSPANLPHMMMKLRCSDVSKRNTQSQLNFLQLAYFISLMVENSEMRPQIVASYEQKFLMKQLAKEGIRAVLGKSSDTVDKIIAQAAELKNPLAPDRLHDFVQKIVEKFMRSSKITSERDKTTVSEYMIRYAFILVRKASDAGNAPDSLQRCEEINRFLELADSALRLVDDEESDTLCNYLTCLLYLVCPYNYEVIQFIARHIQLRASEELDKEFCKNLIHLMEFFWNYSRTSHVTQEESVWYTKREHSIVKCEKEYAKGGCRVADVMGMEIRARYEGTNEAHSSSILSSDFTCSNDGGMVYEKNDVIISDIPPLANKRIPLHVFLMRMKEDLDEIVMPILKAELSIYNVPMWQAVLRNISWLSPRFSRTQLLSSAIFSHANRFAMVERSLPQADKNAIYHLLNNAAQRSVVISTIALLFRKIVLSDVKIELLQMGVELAERWIGMENIQPEERDSLEEQCFRLKDGIAKFSTELTLKKNGMFNEKTSDKIEKVEELCALIYEEMIEWNNTTDVASKCAIVEQIATANSVDLTAFHEKYLFDWIQSQHNSGNQFSNVDMNDTLGDISVCLDEVKEENHRSDDILRLPLFERNLQKMVIVSERIDRKKLLLRLATIVCKGAEHAVGGYEAVVKASCLILRIFNDEELINFNEQFSHNWICNNLIHQAYQRLLSLTNVKANLDSDRKQIIKSLLQCPSRTAPMTATIACMMIDEQYKDVRSIEQVMARLQIAKQWDVLRALLNYAISSDEYTKIRSLPLLWFRVYENTIMSINGGTIAKKEWTNSQCVAFRRQTIWAMGCKMEGGRQPSISRFLRDISCTVSASIISVLSSFTIDKMDRVDRKHLIAERDLPLLWAGNSCEYNDDTMEC